MYAFIHDESQLEKPQEKVISVQESREAADTA
jgi:hypothetical protein